MLVTQKDTEISAFNLPYVELNFGLTGQTLPADHGYGLYSALSHLQPDLHHLDGLSIQTITGIPDKQGKIYLSDKSRLRIRLPGDKVPLVYPLAGKHLTIGIHHIRLGIPQIFELQPASRLRSRIVTIKKFQEPEPFLDAAQRQLDELGIEGRIAIPINAEGEPDRKAIKIKQYSVVGFGLEVSNLSDESSLVLQQVGLGGKRRMGCGVFSPCKEKS